MDYPRPIAELCERIPALTPLAGDLAAAAAVCRRALEGGGTLFLCGNGGSRADAGHIAGELVKPFRRSRPLPSGDAQRLREHFGADGDRAGRGLQQGLRAVVLGSEDALTTAICNDMDQELIFAQPLYVLGRPGDVLLALSTSGNARNVLQACRVARLKAMEVVAFTGAGGGTLAGLATVCLRAPASETALVQELHVPLYHALCAVLEDAFFPAAGAGL